MIYDLMDVAQRESLYRHAALPPERLPPLKASVVNSWLADLVQDDFSNEDDYVSLQNILMRYTPDARICADLVTKFVINCHLSGRREITLNLPTICDLWGSASLGEEFSRILNETLHDLALHPDGSVSRNAKITLERKIQ